MIKLFKRNKVAKDKVTQDKKAILENESEPLQEENQPIVETNNIPSVSKAESLPKKTLFQRLKFGLKKTRSHFGEGLSRLLYGKKQIDEELLEEIETQLLVADIGVETTQAVIKDLTNKVQRKDLDSGEALYQSLKQHLVQTLIPVSKPLVFECAQKPFMLLMVGVNGAGKTTTIGKLTRKLLEQNYSVMLAAGDTFRAAAVEQLKMWGEKNQVPVIAQHTGADSASVIYDAYQSAKARNIDVLIADTAGRLHTQSNLMEELKKIKRVVQKIDNQAPHEVMLVLDASIGQNAISQAEQFNQIIGVTGITMTKLDGTAKGGILFAIAKRLNVPIRFIGVGESSEDLRAFNAEEFVAALFDEE